MGSRHAASRLTTFAALALLIFTALLATGCARPQPAEDQLWKIMKHHYHAR